MATQSGMPELLGLPAPQLDLRNNGWCRKSEPLLPLGVRLKVFRNLQLRCPVPPAQQHPKEGCGRFPHPSPAASDVPMNIFASANYSLAMSCHNQYLRLFESFANKSCNTTQKNVFSMSLFCWGFAAPRQHHLLWTCSVRVRYTQLTATPPHANAHHKHNTFSLTHTHTLPPSHTHTLTHNLHGGVRSIPTEKSLKQQENLQRRNREKIDKDGLCHVAR